MLIALIAPCITSPIIPPIYKSKRYTDLNTAETAYSSHYAPLPDYKYESGHSSYGKHANAYGNHGYDDYGQY